MTQHVTGKRTASDINGYLITTYTAMQAGWVPPDTVTLEQYHQYRKNQDINDPMTGFIGIGMSFGGAWFNGFSNQYGQDGSSKRSVIRKMTPCQDVTFLHCEYDQHDPIDQIIYCDPPYAGTNGYHASNFTFDHTKFWDTVRKWSETNTVLVSEYNAPSDFKCVAEFPTHMQMNQNNAAARLDKVWTLNESPSLFRWSSNKPARTCF